MSIARFLIELRALRARPSSERTLDDEPYYLASEEEMWQAPLFDLCAYAQIAPLGTGMKAFAIYAARESHRRALAGPHPSSVI